MVFATIYKGYRTLMDDYSDPRVNNWPMMSGPFPTMAVCLAYVFVVKVVGPKFMENRKAYTLRKTLIAYNLFQVILSTWLFYEAMDGAWLRDYSLKCQPVDYSNNPKALRVANGCWWYYFSKFTEFFDTFFFILRKKFDQVSTLHVIHHGIMPLSVWFGVKFTPGGHSTFFGLLNAFVHMIMYTYYLLAAMGPEIQKYLWWKKYLTTLQMIQFIAVFVHAFQLLFIECDYPKAFVYWIGAHAVLFYFLFSDFYKQAYIKQQRLNAAMLAAAKASGKGKAISNGNGTTTEPPKKGAESVTAAAAASQEQQSRGGIWQNFQIPCMLPAVTDSTTSESSEEDDNSVKNGKREQKAYTKPAGDSPKASYTADANPLRNRAFVSDKKQ